MLWRDHTRARVNTPAAHPGRCGGRDSDRPPPQGFPCSSTPRRAGGSHTERAFGRACGRRTGPAPGVLSLRPRGPRAPIPPRTSRPCHERQGNRAENAGHPHGCPTTHAIHVASCTMTAAGKAEPAARAPRRHRSPATAEQVERDRSSTSVPTYRPCSGRAAHRFVHEVREQEDKHDARGGECPWRRVARPHHGSAEAVRVAERGVDDGPGGDEAVHGHRGAHEHVRRAQKSLAPDRQMPRDVPEHARKAEPANTGRDRKRKRDRVWSQRSRGARDQDAAERMLSTREHYTVRRTFEESPRRRD